MNADLLDRLLAAGTPTALVAEVAMEIARAEVASEAKAEPSAGALRTRRYRERLERERHAASQHVTGDAPVTVVTDNVTAAPSPDKTPQTPKINPIPQGGEAPAREPTHEGPIPGWLLPDLLTAQAIAYLAALTARRDAALNALWNGTPPPPDVTDETWSGWLAHRKAMPKAGKFTPYAYRLFCARLAKISADTGMPPGELIDLAIVSNWQTVHPPKESSNGHRTRPSHHDRPSGWVPRPGMDGVEPASLDDVYGP